jgi:hypothetical protein
VSWILSTRQYRALTEHAEVVARAAEQVKVLRLANGDLAKLFWMRRKPSSGWFYPYTIRFARNARRLNEMGIPSMRVKRTHFVPGQWLHLVVYEELPGQTLYELDMAEYLQPLARFIAMLHQKGVYFRGLHLGNVVRLADGSYGLIDVANVQFKNRALTPGERVRNLQHMIRRADNRERFGWEGTLALLESYLDGCESFGDDSGLSSRIERFKLTAKSQF